MVTWLERPPSGYREIGGVPKQNTLSSVSPQLFNRQTKYLRAGSDAPLLLYQTSKQAQRDDRAWS